MEENETDNQQEESREAKRQKRLKERNVFHSTIPDTDRLAVVSQKNLQRKAEKKSHHCNHCWFVREGCICSLIKPIQFSNNLKFLIFMHYRGISVTVLPTYLSEVWRASNTAKLLLQAAPLSSQLFVYPSACTDAYHSVMEKMMMSHRWYKRSTKTLLTHLFSFPPWRPYLYLTT